MSLMDTLSNHAMYRIAQQVTDTVYGKGAYAKMNGFDPSKGETHASGLRKRPKRKGAGRGSRLSPVLTGSDKKASRKTPRR